MRVARQLLGDVFGLQAQEVQKLAYFVVELGSVAHGDTTVNRVVVAPPDAGSRDESGCYEIGHDSLCGPLGNAHRLSDVTQAHIRVSLKAEEYLGVARDEVPALVFRS